MGISATLARMQRWHRQKFGCTVEFNGDIYRVTTEETSGANVGQNALSVLTLGAFIASTDPRVFNFDPLDFLPTTEVLAPVMGDEIIWMDLRYLLTRVTYDNVGDDTVAVLAYGYRRII